MSGAILDTTIRLRVKTLLICLYTFIAICIIFQEIYLANISTQDFRYFTNKKVITKRFLYLIQTEQCLWEHLLQTENVLKTTECQCDVIVYSYKTECLDTQYKHMVYLYEPNTTSTWNTGRNLMYKVARERDESYLYYIFFDGDIQLTYNEAIAPKSMRRRSPMRSFERFLIEQEPGVGVADYLIHHGANHIISKMQTLCKEHPISDPSNRTSTDSLYLTSVHFDACFNAFHHEIVDEILPYITDYDDTSWFISQLYTISLVELKFRGQAVLFRPVIANNMGHGSYPQNIGSMPDDWHDLMGNITLTIPAKYQKIDWLEQFTQNPAEYTDNSLTICFVPPYQDPFTSYSHLSLNWSV